MKVVETAIPEVKIFVPKKFADHRGFFSETYNKKVFENWGVRLDFIQDNHSLSAEKGTIRGLHFQTPPFALDKLIRVIKGSIFDVAVDIRKNSPTFGKHVSMVLSADQGNQALIPIGFAHGFCTLEPSTEVIYKVTNYYSPTHDKGLLWNDPDLAIEWPVTGKEAVLSDKDKVHPRLRNLKDLFEYKPRD
ncbi:MAG: dTDP-4-dehydrorhamnose 3,5-epimerase [Deltaproteobacteria bacterium]|nr:dTDP-4-dehydrorhamnose 3,5-epimerase [Deltaproteobacteria bacterium]